MLRVNGTSFIQLDDPLLEQFAGAQLIVRVRATQIFRIARATSIECRWWKRRPTCHAPATFRRYLRGSVSRHSPTCCQWAIRRMPITQEDDR